MQLINGNNIAKTFRFKLSELVKQLERPPRLGIIQVGNDEATEIYVGHKVSDAEEVGMQTHVWKKERATYEELRQIIHDFNRNELIDGFLIQFPMPVDGNITSLLKNIAPHKDIDGLNPINLGSLWQGTEGFMPATVRAVLVALEYVARYSDNMYSVEELNPQVSSQHLSEFIEGKDIVIINHSFIVGKPLAALLVNLGGTVSICHHHTKNLKEYTQSADIVITATGKVGLLTSDMISEQAVLIDVGIKQTSDGVKGDVDSLSVQSKAGWLTPVPGGVGPLTRAMLLWNTLEAYTLQNKSHA
ncbi:bifunctional 5,10-methylenetetrahydrofolate dehydrogenase/5,10-methenyltetrahydrofolate cyclohydrolase [Candidatus Dojkabacteria bacterium]|uniref:Bifunctional protein FolD n=1 Tax=Candidatus Dojkabacteria bacterium TaxID=2099670 RepID=A0A955RKL3_9BACT|nr:bifunctional 5,10-methylenetetrahydrofolate dehydrogenase/5,10-methenyltetrahydrofolate cyclohydrolase [Candidatus Dojkabacteria bacterium]